LDEKAISKVYVAIIVVVLVVAAIFGGYYYLQMLNVAPAKKEIVIGAAVAMSGIQAVSGNLVVKGYRAWEYKVNSEGGIFGLPVRLVIYDDKSDPTTTKLLYERLITVDKCDYLFGPYGTGNAFTAAPLAEEYKMVVLQPSACVEYFYKANFSYQFQVFPRGVVEYTEPKSEFLIQLPAEKRPKSVAIIFSTTSVAVGTARGAKLKFDEANISVVLYEQFPESSSDVSSVVLKVKQANADAVLIVAMVPDEALLIRTMMEMGVNPKFLLSTLLAESTADAIKMFGTAINGIIGGFYYDPSVNTEENREFLKIYRAMYGVDPEASHVSYGYNAGIILETALKALGKEKLGDQEALRNWLLNNEVRIPMGTWKVDKNAVDKYGLRYPCVPLYVVGQYQVTDSNVTVKIIWPS
jgi:branched-chain amino acid transport system substrate-binding protein